MGTGSAPVTAAIVPGGRRRAGSCRARADRLVLREAVQALLVKLLIRYRPTLAAHARLPEPAATFQQPVVALALHDILPRRPIRRGALRAVGHFVGIAETGSGWLGCIGPADRSSRALRPIG